MWIMIAYLYVFLAFTLIAEAVPTLLNKVFQFIFNVLCNTVKFIFPQANV